MIPSIVNSKNEIVVGNDAAWLLSFRSSVDDDKPFEIGRDDYYADIKATLPSGFQGGEYCFEIEGLIDDHYKIIKKEGGTKNAFVDLYLYWRDTTSAVGYLKSVAGLQDALGNLKSETLGDAYRVAKLAISSVKRKKGSRHYVTTIVAKERVFAAAASDRICLTPTTEDNFSAIEKLLVDASVPCETYRFDNSNGSSAPAADDCSSLTKGVTTHEAVDFIAKRIEKKYNKHGRGLLLIRDGVLHVGKRDFPLKNEPTHVHEAAGLIEIETLAPVPSDPHFNRCENPTAAPPTRKQFKLTLKGRPDIKPGDVVKFMPPITDLDSTTGSIGGSLIQSFSGSFLPAFAPGVLGPNHETVYVGSVDHKLGRSTGFVTTLTGLAIELNDPWDTHSRNTRGEKKCRDAAQSASPAGRAVTAQTQLIQRQLATRYGTQIAEVRAVHTSGTEEPVAQTSSLWRGLADADGGNHQSRRLPIQHPSDAPIDGVPYATPFAWGKAGLVLPRYPGTRVAITHHNHDQGEPIDLGALWQSGKAPDSEAGDWWLILPVDSESAQRESVNDETHPAGYEGPASNDLIDASGNRIIEIGSFTLRYGKEKLKDAGTRPAPEAEDSLTIMHADNKAKITMDSDGNISIEGASITLDAGSGDITLKGGAVKVE